MLTAFVALFILQGVDRLAAPFGLSHDGFNGAVWSAGSRAIREDGILASNLGTLRDGGDVYANHPPATVLAVAALETVIGEREIAARLVPVGAGVVALVLTYLLLCRLGIRPTIAACAVAVGFGCPMFFVFGMMVDTPTASLWCGPAILLWLATALRRQPGADLRWFALLACLVVWWSWQATFMAVVAGLVVASRRDLRARAVWWLVGVAVGLALLTAHLAAARDIDALLSQFSVRTGMSAGEEIGIGDWLRRQATFGRDLFGLWYFCWPALLACGLISRKTRVPMAVSFAGVSGYALLLRDASFRHNYWTYWFVVVAAIGVAAAFDGLTTRGLSLPVGDHARAVTIGTLLLASVPLTVVFPSLAQYSVEDGILFGEKIRSANVPRSQEVVPALGVDPATMPVPRYYTRRRLLATGHEAAVRLAVAHPGWLVLRHNPYRPPSPRLVTGRTWLAEIGRPCSPAPPCASP